MKTDTVAVEKLYHDFTFNLSSNEISFEGSDRMVLRRGLKLLLETYPSKTVGIAIENFFIDSYAKGNNFPFRLFLKQIVRYTKAPSVYQISLNDLLIKHFKNPETGLVYEDINYANDDHELGIIKKMETGSLGTIIDVSLEDIEKAIAKRVYNQGKDSVPSSWTDAYFNRVKIYSNPILYKKERDLAKNKQKEKTSVDKHRKKIYTLIEDLKELAFLYQEGSSKKIKYKYIDTKFKEYSEKFKEDVRMCKTSTDFENLIKRVQKGEPL